MELIQSLGYDIFTQESDNNTPPIQRMASGGKVSGRRGQPTLAIITSGEKVVNTFGPKETSENIIKENAYAQRLGLNVPQFATGSNPIQGAKNFISGAYGKIKDKGSEFLKILQSDDMADLVLELMPDSAKAKVDKNKIQDILGKTATAIPRGLKGAGIGGIVGFLTGMPLVGMAVGSGIGIASVSDTVKTFLFGKTNDDGTFSDTGIIKKNVQDYVTAKAPGMKLGAISGVVATLLGAGPFGLLGNAVLGAGTSLLVTSDKFKDFMLGEADSNGKRSGGIIGDLKLRFVDPLVQAGKELIDEGKKFFKINVFDNIQKFLGVAGNFIAKPNYFLPLTSLFNDLYK